jgi:hypothetical protein
MDEHASFSQAAYDAYYLGHHDAEKKLQERYPDHYIDGDLSDDTGVVISKPDGTGVVAFRGTDPRNMYDLAADALVLSGYHREKNSHFPRTRFARANDLYERAKQHYEVTSLTGHSLGGTLADYVARRHDLEAHVFNPGESPFEYFRFGRTIPSKSHVYTTGSDAISYSSNAYRRHQDVNYRPKTEGGGWFMLDSHSLGNFIRPKKINDARSIDTHEHIEHIEDDCVTYPERCFRRRRPAGLGQWPTRGSSLPLPS